ncbi:MAG: hypothetical protein NDI69_05255 [Bacteriovoracaceae bacterium]|nr:hypothetical protein [Bacteriovoracaceae bacterium]
MLAFQRLSLFTLLLATASCGFDVTSVGGNAFKLFGSVPSLKGIVSTTKPNSSYAYASTCTAYVDLIQLDQDDLPIYPAIASTPISNDGTFTFTSEEDLLGDKVDHILEVRTEGTCDAVLQRPVTHIKNPQNITPYTTVVTFAKDAELSRKLVDISKTDMEKLLQETTITTNHEQAYQELLNRSSEFSSVFGDVPTKLATSAPMVQQALMPTTTIKEGSVNNLQIIASHWSPDYTVAIQWKLDGANMGQVPQWSYIPNANSQGTHHLEAYIGADDGSGKVDTTKPYHYYSKVFTITNDVLPSPPQLNLANTLVASTNVTVGLLTGPGMINCESFSSLAATVNDSSAPISFMLDCQTANVQDLALTLPAGDGTKTIRLWARDDAGVISAMPSTLTLILDQTAPQLSLTVPMGTKRGGETVTLPLSALDASSVTQLKLYYSVDNGSTYTLLSNLTAGATSFAWTLPVVNAAQVKLKLSATDSLGNVSEVISDPFTIDSTAPAVPSLSLSSGSPTSSIDLNLSLASCADYHQIHISESATAPTLEALNWQSCSTSLSYSLSSAVSGNRTVYLHARDAAGNISSASSVVVTLDQLAPTLSFNSSLNGIYKGNEALNVIWSASDDNFAATPIKIEYTTDNGFSWNVIIAATANDNSEIWTLPATDNSEVKLRLTATDLAGNSTSVISQNFAIETSLPSVLNFAVNNNSGESSIFGNINLEASSTISHVTHFCIKNATTTTPLLSDSCWVAVNSPQPGISPGLAINFADYSQMISYTPGPTSVSAWVKSEAGNISTASTVYLDVLAPSPPVVSSILVANISSPSDPVVTSEKIFNGSQSAFIKWRVTSQTAATITIFYTNNSGTTTVATNLANGSNNGCTINDSTTADDQATGCYELANAPSGYFTITIRASDAAGISSQSTSYPLNASRIKVLAGNTDLGLNTSALSSIHRIASAWSDVGSLVVTTKGRIFLRDLTLGLVTVDPKDGIVRQVMPITGSSTGDGGPVSSATFNFPHKIALDFQDRLLIFDKTRIRRINTNVNPMTIETIIGSNPTSTANGISAANFQLNDPVWSDSGHNGSKMMPFFALPNGDIYFSSGNVNNTIASGVRIYRYQASDGKVYTITPSGVGHSEDPSVNIQTKSVYGFGVTYDPNTSAIGHMHLRITQAYVGDGGGALVNLDPQTYVSTAPHAMKAGRNDYQIQGMDGKLYVYNARDGRLQRFEPGTGIWTTLVGGGANALCPDNTLATNCQFAVHKAAEFFISATGQIYFVDRFGIVRVVLADKTVRRIMGQSKNAGDNGPATEARLNTINWLDQANDGTIFISDGVENKIRKFTIDGNISAHANSVTTNQETMHLNRATKEIYSFSSYGSIYKLPFATLSWANVGTTTLNYDSKNNNISGLWGFDQSDNLLYMVQPSWNQTDGYRDFKLANFKLSTSTPTLLTGYKGTSASFAVDGTLAVDAAISTGQVRAQYDSSTVPHRWLMLAINTNRIVALNKDGMNNGESLLTFHTLPQNAYSFVYRRAANNDEIIDYCGADKKLHSYNITTATPTDYQWPINALACSEKTLNYNSSRNSLIFPARMNNLSTVIEYQLDN